jgi:hypothetical protein
MCLIYYLQTIAIIKGGGVGELFTVYSDFWFWGRGDGSKKCSLGGGLGRTCLYIYQLLSLCPRITSSFRLGPTGIEAWAVGSNHHNQQVGLKTKGRSPSVSIITFDWQFAVVGHTWIKRLVVHCSMVIGGAATVKCKDVRVGSQAGHGTRTVQWRATKGQIRLYVGPQDKKSENLNGPVVHARMEALSIWREVNGWKARITQAVLTGWGVNVPEERTMQPKRGITNGRLVPVASAGARDKLLRPNNERGNAIENNLIVRSETMNLWHSIAQQLEDLIFMSTYWLPKLSHIRLQISRIQAGRDKIGS